MITRALSAVLLGLDGSPVDVETDLSNGLPTYTVVGLPDATVKESRDRIRAAIKNAGLQFPMKRITINLAPAHTRKEGSHLDLPMALGILSASEQISHRRLVDTGFLGELSLNGELQPVQGILPLVIALRNIGLKAAVVPTGNCQEAALVEGIDVYGFDSLSKLCQWLNDEVEAVPNVASREASTASREYDVDFSEVVGQEQAKRALEIAAAGSHNLLVVGSPGAGKSMLAKRFPTILPDLSYEEALEVTKIYSVSGILGDRKGLVLERPFRAPHHTISAVSLVGGGRLPKPGEISLAHYGVLYLDEFTEFNRMTLEVLRQPMEDEQVTISRVNQSVTFPCKFTLLASMNPCPCGYLTDPVRQCTCSPNEVKKYLSKVSGPLLDRIDLQVEVMPVAFEALRSVHKATSSETMKERVAKARQIQLERYKRTKILYNSQLTSAMMRRHCQLDPGSEALLESAFRKLNLSARAYAKLLKISRTIADLEGCESIEQHHLAEAIQYRKLDRTSPYGR